MLRFGFLLFSLSFLTGHGWSQACSNLGQTPASAFPVCGATKFQQLSVPLCGNKSIPTQCGNSGGYTDRNPYWYKFTCYKAGTLGFIITPLAPNEDYDWQLFDITGRNPDDVFTDASLYVSSNWAGTYAATGTSPNATVDYECASVPQDNKPTFSKMPVLILGHEYILMVSHFTDTQSGYTLSFEGGTASIVNPVKPEVTKTYGVCDGTEMTVVLSKKVKCSSLAANGSDFTITGPQPNSIISATGRGCSTSFDMDTIRLQLSNPMVLGTYRVTTKTGTDGNTLLDNCDLEMNSGLQSTSLFTPAIPTPMDSITPPVCIQDSVQLVFRKPMLCSSIAPDGSDFIITGAAPVTIRGAKGVCVNGVSTYISVLFSAPIRVNGAFIITLKNGTDGNTLIDECQEQTPAGSALSFITKDITVADFQPQVSTDCKYDTLHLSHDGNGNANQWTWAVNAGMVSTAQHHTLVSRAFGDHIAQLTVSNGICSDVVTRTFTLPDNTVKAAYSVPSDTLCPSDALECIDESSANTVAWRWSFGNGAVSNSRSAVPQHYPNTGRISQYVTSLAVRNSLGCADTTYKIITVLASCYLAVPSAFTPNGDGLNDYFYPLNAFKAADMIFRVYDRWGKLIFESRNWTKKWDGRFKGLPQPAGTYVWTFSYTDKDTGQKVVQKGTTILIR